VDTTYFAIAFLAGLIPALFWLWFWLREDVRKPEPFFLIAITFIAGMAVVPMVIPLSRLALDLNAGLNIALDKYELMVIWVTIEELLKYAVALIVIFWNRAVDEPIDMVIYMIVIALGFAALENALFIFDPLIDGFYISSALTGSWRFLGATLLHVLASGTIGVLLALTYYRTKLMQLIAGTVGLFIAIVLHALFNFFIMRANEEPASGELVLAVFLAVWMGIIILFLFFEKIKMIERAHTKNVTYKN
jgi:Predicted membrane protein